ncbi:MAG: hypothetical protein RLZ22_539 [Verrucomicrobiota bacterium]|jgi:DNA repair exonuclease SbcCD ATPase subunit
MKLLNRPPKFDLSKPERERLTAAAKEIDSINRRFAEIAALRSTLAAAAQDFISGKMSIIEAVKLGSFSRVDHEVAQGNLQRALKARLRELLDQSADLIFRHRQHAANVAQARLDEAEAVERKAARTAGIDDDDFRPSGNLERLTAELYAAKDLCGDEWPIRQHDLANLLEAAGLAAPARHIDDD